MGMGIVVEILWGMRQCGSVELHVEWVCISACEEGGGGCHAHSCSGKYFANKGLTQPEIRAVYCVVLNLQECNLSRDLRDVSGEEEIMRRGDLPESCG